MTALALSDAALLDAVDAQASCAEEVMGFVHDHPELGHEEYCCAEYLAGTLEQAGLAVERGAGGMATAFRATLAGGRPGPTVAAVAVYDAVPAIADGGRVVPTHSCGHGPLAAGVVAAGRALAGLRDDLCGTFVVIGCPADEIHAPQVAVRGGGKAGSVTAGVWRGVDAALYVHPEFIDTVSQASLCMSRQVLRSSGLRSLQPDREQRPLDVLRAIAAALDELPPDRFMLERLALDGDVEEGTGMALTASFLVFADDEPRLADAIERLRAIAPTATWSAITTVQAIAPDPDVTAAVADAFAATPGTSFVSDPPPLPFATDFGNISHVVPAALVGVGRPGGWAFHTDEGARQFAAEGAPLALQIARVIALATARLTHAGDDAR